MMNGRNNGKKLMAIRIVAHAFEIVCQIFSISRTRRIPSDWVAVRFIS